MKARTILLMVCALLAVLAMVENTWASTTYAYAAISRSGDGAANDSDSDSAFGYCQSYAEADCPANHAAWASTTSTVTVSYTPGSGYSKIIGTSVTPSNSEPQLYSGHAFTNNGSATFWDWNAKLIGAGLKATLQYNLSKLDLKLPVLGSRTNTLAFNIDNAPVVAGSVTLNTYGPGPTDYNLITDGYFVESFFDVFFDVSLQTWNANYIGPAYVEKEVDVDSFFDVFFEVTSMGDGVGGDLNLLETNLVVPDGYTLIPEPAALSLLLLGLGFLRQRRS